MVGNSDLPFKYLNAIRIDGRGGVDGIACRDSPEQSSTCCNGVQVVILGAEVDRAIIDGWRRGNRPTSGETPDLTTVALIERVQIVVRRANVDHTFGDGWRGFDRTARGEGPEWIAAHFGIEGIYIAIL